MAEIHRSREKEKYFVRFCGMISFLRNSGQLPCGRRRAHVRQGSPTSRDALQRLQQDVPPGQEARHLLIIAVLL
jgi:hypothetical protein